MTDGSMIEKDMGTWLKDVDKLTSRQIEELALSHVKARVYLVDNLHVNAITIGRLIILKRDVWENKRKLAAVLRHEAVHVAQQTSLGPGGNPWMGFAVFALFYGLLFFPAFLAYFRMKWEVEAYRVSLESYSLMGESEEMIAARREAIVKSLISAKYLWCWYSKDALCERLS